MNSIPSIQIMHNFCYADMETWMAPVVQHVGKFYLATQQNSSCLLSPGHHCNDYLSRRFNQLASIQYSGNFCTIIVSIYSNKTVRNFIKAVNCAILLYQI